VIVVDASVAIEILLGTEEAARLRGRVLRPRQSLHCPHLLDVEVAQVLRRYARAGELSDERGRQALGDLAALPMMRYPHEPFLRRIWELRDNVITAYDAAYISLAEALDAPLVTRDSRLASAHGHEARVEVV
jgi:predicted nucleic acid-binding protein